MQDIRDPIVLIGGFGSHWSDYQRAAQLLANVSGRRVFITGITRATWLVGGVTNYSPLVDRAHNAIDFALKETGAEKVIIVGHSAGGIVGRAYLGDQTLKPHQRSHRGHERVSRLYMIGSPLRQVGDVAQQGMRATSWVDRTYPGAYFADKGVRYLTVRGKFVKGKIDGTFRERQAFLNYQFISGVGEQWGDGVVPLSLSELDGAITLTLDGVGHSPAWNPWFFSDEATVRGWWHYFDLGDAPTFEREQMVV
jgi:pimeloyl-ACP methyl ester carboxylesterase